MMNGARLRRMHEAQWGREIGPQHGVPELGIAGRGRFLRQEDDRSQSGQHGSGTDEAGAFEVGTHSAFRRLSAAAASALTSIAFRPQLLLKPVEI